jgi:hypothetical protein
MGHTGAIFSGSFLDMRLAEVVGLIQRYEPSITRECEMTLRKIGQAMNGSIKAWQQGIMSDGETAVALQALIASWCNELEARTTRNKPRNAADTTPGPLPSAPTFEDVGARVLKAPSACGCTEFNARTTRDNGNATDSTPGPLPSGDKSAPKCRDPGSPNDHYVVNRDVWRLAKRCNPTGRDHHRKG